MKLRPYDTGCQPLGNIDYKELNKKETGFWGELTYDRKLTEQEIYKYDLATIL